MCLKFTIFLKAYHEALRERNNNDVLIQKFNVLYHVCQDCFIFLCAVSAKIGYSDCDEDFGNKTSRICFSCFFQL